MKKKKKMDKNLRIYPDAVLKEKARKVESVQGMGGLIERMIEIMVENEGIGLAANQIGIASRIFVMRIEEKKPIRIINPVIVEMDGEDKMKEGCLSIPDASVEIARAESLVLQGFDPDGSEVEYKLKGLEARVAQHEIDHLNGVLIIDYFPKKEILKFQREYEKMMEEIP